MYVTVFLRWDIQDNNFVFYITIEFFTDIFKLKKILKTNNE